MEARRELMAAKTDLCVAPCLLWLDQLPKITVRILTSFRGRSPVKHSFQTEPHPKDCHVGETIGRQRASRIGHRQKR